MTSRPSLDRVLMLLHAFPLDKSVWDGVVGPVSEAGWDVVVPDLRGFGESRYGPDGPDDEPSLAAMARDVVGILDRIGARSAVVGGLSMGGYVAMELLRQTPDRVAAMILADTKGTADDDVARANRLRVAEQVLAAGSTEALARAMVPTLVGTTTLAARPAVVDRVRRVIEATDPAAVAWAQRAMAARPDSLPTLAGFAGPALVLWGEQDVVSPRSEQDLLLASLAGGRFEIVEDAGHLSAMEAPEAVSAALVRFLAEVPAGPG
ncbi:MAG TPA: alpha/beta hydrolase [Candidatus Nanopelagicales bacterium]